MPRIADLLKLPGNHRKEISEREFARLERRKERPGLCWPKLEYIVPEHTEWSYSAEIVKRRDDTDRVVATIRIGIEIPRDVSKLDLLNDLVDLIDGPYDETDEEREARIKRNKERDEPIPTANPLDDYNTGAHVLGAICELYDGPIEYYRNPKFIDPPEV